MSMVGRMPAKRCLISGRTEHSGAEVRLQRLRAAHCCQLGATARQTRSRRRWNSSAKITTRLCSSSPDSIRKSDQFQQWVVDLGRWLYSTDHIKVHYSIEYEGVSITQLSPGTRESCFCCSTLLLTWRTRAH